MNNGNIGKIKAVVFDLDGTLLDTLEDLADSVNFSLKSFGYQERTIEEVRSFVGNGVRNLMIRALPQKIDDATFEKVFATFRSHYMEHCQDKTHPYNGIMPLLTSLNEKGIKCAIVSNKLQPAVEKLRQQFFGEYIQTAIGESKDVKRKPAPDAILLALQQLNCSKEEIIYIGDSEVDIVTSRAAETRCIAVTWGFRNKSLLEEHHPDFIAETPDDILYLLTENI